MLKDEMHECRSSRLHSPPMFSHPWQVSKQLLPMLNTCTNWVHMFTIHFKVSFEARFRLAEFQCELPNSSVSFRISQPPSEFQCELPF